MILSVDTATVNWIDRSAVVLLGWRRICWCKSDLLLGSGFVDCLV